MVILRPLFCPTLERISSCLKQHLTDCGYKPDVSADFMGSFACLAGITRHYSGEDHW